MPRSPTSPATRIEKLGIARTRAKTELKRGETLSAAPMAGLLGVTWKTLSGWCDDIDGFAESGAFDRGGEGIEYVFRPLKTIDYLIKHFTAEREARAMRARRTRKLAAGNALDDLPDDYSLEEIAKIVTTAAKVREERERQGQLVEAGKVTNAVREAFSKMQQAGLRSAQEQDPTGLWPVEIRESFEDAINSVILSMEMAGRECIRAIRGGSA